MTDGLLPKAPPKPARRLATLVSAAARIEPQLIRAVRLNLLPGLDVGSETDLWFSDWVCGRSTAMMVLDPAVLPDLHRRLARWITAGGPDRAERLRDQIRTMHAELSPALQMQERVSWAALSGQPDDAIDRELEPALQALVAQSRNGVADWLVGAWHSLPERVRRSRTGWQLAQVARHRLPGSRLSPLPPARGLTTGDLEPILDAVPTVRLRIRREGADADILVPDTDPRVIEVFREGPDSPGEVLLLGPDEYLVLAADENAVVRSSRRLAYRVDPSPPNGRDDGAPADGGFTGRVAALGALTDWLKGAGPSTLMVTGRPGSGKSAILARIAALATTEPRNEGGPGIRLPLGAVSGLIDARGRTSPEVIGHLAQVYGVATETPVNTITALVRRLGARKVMGAVVIDGLDEMVPSGPDGASFYQDLRRLARVQAVRAPRLLLAARRPRPEVGDSTEVQVVDLDSDAFFARADLSEYVRSLLVRSRPPSPSQQMSSEHLSAAADAVARAAGKNFLLAQVVARGLATRDYPADPRRLHELPRSLRQAWDADLSRRFGDDAERARSVMLPLAYAGATGMPWDVVWARMVRALTNTACSTDDVHEIIGSAGDYVTERTVGARSYYRPFHEAFREYLLMDRDQRADRAVVAEMLTRSVPQRPDGTRDRSRAHPWIVAMLGVTTQGEPVVEDTGGFEAAVSAIDFDWDGFDSDAYFNQNFEMMRADDAAIIEIVAEVFAKTLGTRRQLARGVDLGSGTNLYPALLLLPYCSQISLIESSFANCEWLETQLHSPSPSWKQFWTAMSGGRQPSRHRIKKPLDVLSQRASVKRGNAFTLRPDEYGVGTMFFYAEANTLRIDEFERTVHAFMRSLRPTAPFAAAFTRRGNFYSVGRQLLPALSVDENDVRHAMAPFAKSLSIRLVDGNGRSSDGDGVIVATGRRI